MTDILTLMTALIVTAISVALGGVAVEGVLMMLGRALQDSVRRTSLQQAPDAGELRLSFADAHDATMADEPKAAFRSTVQGR